MIYIVITIILLLALLLIVVSVYNNKLSEIYIKILESKESINVLLHKKLELILNIFNDIENVSENKYKEDIDISSDKKLNMFELNDKLNSYYNRIIEIVEINNDVVLSDESTEKVSKVKSISTELNGVETYYNENAEKFNKLIGKFPNNITSMLKKYKKLDLFNNTKKEIFEILEK